MIDDRLMGRPGEDGGDGIGQATAVAIEHDRQIEGALDPSVGNAAVDPGKIGVAPAHLGRDHDLGPSEPLEHARQRQAGAEAVAIDIAGPSEQHATRGSRELQESFCEVSNAVCGHRIDLERRKGVNVTSLNLVARKERPSLGATRPCLSRVGPVDARGAPG